jgi:hypothetical protein
MRFLVCVVWGVKVLARVIKKITEEGLRIFSALPFRNRLGFIIVLLRLFDLFKDD